MTNHPPADLYFLILNGEERWAISPREACELTGIGRTTMYRLLEEGGISSEKVGNKILVHADPLARRFNVESAVPTATLAPVPGRSNGKRQARYVSRRSSATR